MISIWFEYVFFKNSKVFQYVSKLFNKILWNTIDSYLLNDVSIIFFGDVVMNIFKLEDCISNVKYDQILKYVHKNCKFHDFSLIWMHQLKKFKYLSMCVQIFLWICFWIVFILAYRMIYSSYFLDLWLRRISCLKIVFRFVIS